MRRTKFFSILKKDKNTTSSMRSGSITRAQGAGPRALTGVSGSPGPIMNTIIERSAPRNLKNCLVRKAAIRTSFRTCSAEQTGNKPAAVRGAGNSIMNRNREGGGISNMASR